MLNRLGGGSSSPNCPSFTGFRGSVTSHIDIPSTDGSAELQASLLWSRRSPSKNGVWTSITWTPSPGNSFALADRNPTSLGFFGFLTSTTLTPPPSGQFG